jgi:hypothetical protein
MSQVVKGMVQVQGTTYRIVRITRGNYSVVRVLDDVVVGTFTAGTAVKVTNRDIEPAVMREIARIAIQGAKTSWVGRI